MDVLLGAVFWGEALWEGCSIFAGNTRVEGFFLQVDELSVFVEKRCIEGIFPVDLKSSWLSVILHYIVTPFMAGVFVLNFGLLLLLT